MAFNEDTRVKIPAILHLCRLGYGYLSLSTSKIDPETNIFTDIFIQSIGRLNPELEEDDIGRLLKEIRVKLDNDDLRHAFYKMMTALSSQENQHLTSLRDWLLPMLMNGQVRVNEVEERMSMAAETSGKYRN